MQTCTNTEECIARCDGTDIMVSGGFFLELALDSASDFLTYRLYRSEPAGETGWRVLFNGDPGFPAFSESLFAYVMCDSAS